MGVGKRPLSLPFCSRSPPLPHSVRRPHMSRISPSQKPDPSTCAHAPPPSLFPSLPRSRQAVVKWVHTRVSVFRLLSPPPSSSPIDSLIRAATKMCMGRPICAKCFMTLFIHLAIRRGMISKHYFLARQVAEVRSLCASYVRSQNVETLFN